MRSGVVFSLLLALLLPFVPVAAGSAEARPTPPSHVTDEVREALDLSGQRPSSAELDRLASEARARGRVGVIVGLPVRFEHDAELGLVGRALQRRRVQGAERSLLRDLEGTGARVTRSFQHLPLVALEVPPAAVEGLRRSPHVATVEEDRLVAPSLVDSVPLVGAHDLHRHDIGGGGQAVAIIDTGVDGDHPFFQGRIDAEACFTIDDCPDGSGTQVGSGAAAPCTSFPGRCEHGTHVAGIAAGAWLGAHGVAPDTRILAFQVFSKRTGWACGDEASPCLRARESDVLRAMEQVWQWHTTYDIAAVNLSLGSGEYTRTCDRSFASYRFTSAILLGAGIATVAASGNDGYADAMGSPACLSNVISVGNTTKSDTVNNSSNSAAFLDLLAPGTSITAAVPGGGTGSKDGTSMAAPHVAGAFALMRSVDPDASVSDILSRLKATGAPVHDHRNGLVHPRIDVLEAVGSFGGLCPPDDMYEPNSRREDARRLQLPTRIDGILCGGPNGEDWYAFELSTVPATVDITLRYPYPQEGRTLGGRLELFLYDADGSQIAYSIDAADEQRISVTLEEQGHYHVLVAGFHDAASTYELLLDRSNCPPDDAFAPNHTPPEAAPLRLDGEIDAVLCAGADDHYAVELFAGERVLVQVEDPTVDPASGIDLALLDDQGDEVAVAESLGWWAQLDIVAPASGRHVIAVRGTPGVDEVHYRLRLDREACPPDDPFAPNHTPHTAHLLEHGDVVAGVVCGRAHDYYRVGDIPFGSSVTVEIHRRGFDALPVSIRDLRRSYDPILSSEPIDGGSRIVIEPPIGRDLGELELRVHRGPDALPNERYELRVEVSVCPGDDRDPSDTPSRARALGFGGVVDAIACTDVPDHYALDAQGGSTVTAELRQSLGAGIAAADVLAPDGTVIASGEANHNGYLKVTGVAAEAGRHVVRVRGVDEIASRYTLDARVSVCPPDDEHEPNDTPGAATPLTPGSEPLPAILCAGNVDYFRFDAVAGTVVKVHADYLRADAGDDLRLEILDPDLEVVTVSETASANARVSFRAPVTGTYYARVSGADLAAQNLYRIHVDSPPVCPPDDEFAPNQTVEDAHHLGHGGEVHAILCAPDAPDHFSFQAFAGSEVVVDLPGSILAGTDHDGIEVDLLDPSGQQVASTTDTVPDCVWTPDGFVCTPRPLGTPVRHTVVDSGVHVVRVWTDRTEILPYRLSVEAPTCPPDDDHAPNHTVEEASLLFSGDVVHGVLCLGDPSTGGGLGPDPDLFAVDVEPGQRLVAELDRDPERGELDLVLLDPAADQVLAWRSSSRTERIELAHVAAEAGRHLLMVWAEPGTSNTYRLSVEVADHVDTVPPSVYPTVSPNPIEPGETTRLTASVSDRDRGNSPIVSAEYRVADGPWLPMDPLSGWFGDVSLRVYADLTPDRVGHIDVCVRAEDVLGNRSAPRCLDEPHNQMLHVHDRFPPEVTIELDRTEVAPGRAVQVSATADDRDTGGSDVVAVDARVGFGEWEPLDPQAMLGAPVVSVSGELVLEELGEQLVCVRAVDAGDSTSLPACATVTVSADVAPEPAPGTSLVSRSSDGLPADADAESPSLSADGRVVAFHSAASMLSEAVGTTGRRHVYVHDRDTGTTELLSVTASGAPANAASLRPSISAGGRYVAYESLATDLDGGFANIRDIFVHDRVTGETRRVSVPDPAMSATAANGNSTRASISPDGRYVAFQSAATNLVPGDTNGVTDVFVHDRVTGATVRASVASDGTEATTQSRLDADGTVLNSMQAITSTPGGFVVTFLSAASELTTGTVPTGSEQVYVHDAADGTTSLVSVTSSGAPSDGVASHPAISADGSVVAFASTAADLPDASNQVDVFVFERDTGDIERVNLPEPGGNVFSFSNTPRVSADGSRVVFRSRADLTGPTDALVDTYVRDRALGRTELVSVATDGTPADASSTAPSISDDGRHVAFVTSASNLAPDAPAGIGQVYAAPSGRAASLPPVSIVVEHRITVTDDPVVDARPADDPLDPDTDCDATWTGTADGRWEEPENWSAAVLPGEGALVCVGGDATLPIQVEGLELSLAGIVDDGTIAGSTLLVLHGDTLDLTGTSTVSGGVEQLGGWLWMSPQAALSGSGTYHLVGGNAIVHGTVDLAATTVGPGAALHGTGKVTRLVNEGRLVPGGAHRGFTVAERYTQADPGSFRVRLAGTAPRSQHTVLEVEGSAVLGGHLEVSLDEGYLPSAGDEFVILTADTVSGVFASVALPALDDTLMMAVEHRPEAVALVVTAAGEPGPDEPVPVDETTVAFDASVDEPIQLSLTVDEGDGDVDPIEQAVEVRFVDGQGSGELRAARYEGTPPDADLEGVTLLDGYVDLSVEGDVTFERAEVCLSYTEDELDEVDADEEQLRLFHFPDGEERFDRTTENDPDAQMVCGETDRFSPFAVGVLDAGTGSGSPRAIAAAERSAETFDPGVALAIVAPERDLSPGVHEALEARTGAPVLLLGDADLPAVTRDELVRLRPDRLVVILGGGVGEDVLAELAGIIEQGSGGLVEHVTAHHEVRPVAPPPSRPPARRRGAGYGGLGSGRPRAAGCWTRGPSPRRGSG